MVGHVMVLYSPDWTNIGFSFILLTVNPFCHSTLIEYGLYRYIYNKVDSVPLSLFVRITLTHIQARFILILILIYFVLLSFQRCLIIELY